jgi:hypothetical protein
MKPNPVECFAAAEGVITSAAKQSKGKALILFWIAMAAKAASR